MGMVKQEDISGCFSGEGTIICCKCCDDCGDVDQGKIIDREMIERDDDEWYFCDTCGKRLC